MIKDIEAQLDHLTSSYVKAHPKSLAALEEARQWLPGANTRTVLHYRPFPVVIDHGQGAHVTDIDGHTYLDCVGEFSADLYGHSDPVIHRSIVNALSKGLTLGGPTVLEARLAQAVCERFTSIEKVRFCNSGTEANLLAMLAAMAVTGRTVVVIFDGAYHGGVMTFPGGHSKMNVPMDWVVLPYNDVDAVTQWFAEHGDSAAAVLVEPILGAAGNLPGSEVFLQTLRELTSRSGTVLIFDEVKTSRCGAGGVQSLVGVTPDMTTLGKYLGGGLPLGAFGGQDWIMAYFDPDRADGLKHAGTFNNNVMSMSAGLTGLTEVFTVERARLFHSEVTEFANRLSERIAVAGLPVVLTGHGSMLTLHWLAQVPVQAPVQAAEVNPQSSMLRQIVLLRCMQAGVRLAGRGDIYLNLAMTAEGRQTISDVIFDSLVATFNA